MRLYKSSAYRRGGVHAIPLVCGNPAEEPASYTRFVLPFSYSPAECAHKGFPWVYKPSKPASIWRKNYLTVETATVLFDRAKWFELQGRDATLDFQAYRDGRSFTVHVGAPCLVLFEWPTDPKAQDEGDLGDPLRIGFLIVEVSFPPKEEPPHLDDLLEFNEKFRFWYQPYDGHEKYYKSVLARCPLDIRHPDRVVKDGDLPAIYFERWASLLEIPIEDEAERTWRLFPETWEQQARVWVSGDRDPWQSGWIVYADNRAFVWTCAIVEGGGKKLQDLFAPSSTEGASFYGHWIKLLNVDRPGSSPADTHNSTQFERDWAKERTYHRWEEHGTFYGFNYHCGAMLGSSETEPPLWKHFGEMYFDQTLLLLYLRVGSFHFSRRLSRISAQARGANEGSEARETWRREFQKLRWSFALFTNLYEFPLLSNQQQGIEMYELAREYLDVEELFREIQEEIRSSHDYLEIEAGQKQAEITTLLTVVATLGLAIGLAIGFLGMNIVAAPTVSSPEGALTIQWRLFWPSVAVSSLLMILSIWGSKQIAKWFRKLANYSIYRDLARGHDMQKGDHP